jgi:hypothetical protein
MRRHSITDHDRAPGESDDIRVVSVDPAGAVVLRWAGGTVRLEVPSALAHYYQRLVTTA